MKRKWIGAIAIAFLVSAGASALGSDTILLKGYLVAEIEVIDPVAYKDYASKAGPVIAACGGKYRARGGRVESLEGGAPRPRFVIVEFASMDIARACYRSPAYQAIAPIRQRASKSRFWLSEGLPEA